MIAHIAWTGAPFAPGGRAWVFLLELARHVARAGVAWLQKREGEQYNEQQSPELHSRNRNLSTMDANTLGVIGDGA